LAALHWFAVMKPQYRFTAALLSTFLIGGCGQKGALFLPGDRSQIHTELPELEPDPAEVEDEDEGERAETVTQPPDEDNGIDE